MEKKVFEDGICENCGNTGLAGEKCLSCGGTLLPLDAQVETLGDGKKDPETYGNEAQKTLKQNPVDIIEEEN